MKKLILLHSTAKFWPFLARFAVLLTLTSFVGLASRTLAQVAPADSPTALPTELPTEPAGELSAPVEVAPESTPAPPVRCRRRLVGNQCLRLRATFFEDERRLRQFRNVDFLEAALDGAGNTITAGSRDRDLINSQTMTDFVTRDDETTAFVTNYDTDDDNFLRGSFLEGIDADTALRIVSVTPDDNPQTGVITLRGRIAGRAINNDDYTNARYRGSAAENGDLWTGVVVVINRNNPREELQIVIPPTNVREEDGDDFVRGPARVSIGRGVDR